MIVWINGSFGVGKTTIAEILKEKLEFFFFVLCYNKKERYL